MIYDVNYSLSPFGRECTLCVLYCYYNRYCVFFMQILFHDVGTYEVQYSFYAHRYNYTDLNFNFFIVKIKLVCSRWGGVRGVG